MKLNHNWLREWVTVPADAQQLTERLTQAGLESSAEKMAVEISPGIVVGRIVKAEKHPEADRLQVCAVDVGGGTILQIVCGAPNAKVGLNAPCATVGATLPGNVKITQAKLRNVDSHGMLCSAKELGLSEKSEGLLELDPDARPGTPIGQYLSFDDDILNLELTPNRGDALSILGLAREVAALYGVQMKRPNLPPAVVVGHQSFKVEIENLDDCPTYTGRVISKLKPTARTPDWMREKLRRSGLRAIHPVVDITNYVMLELGQPLHAFDASRIQGSVRVRRARKGESLRLLNDQVLELDGELLIADDQGPLALGGVMGGAESGVTEVTTSIFLESACFAPHAVAGAGRRHKLHSDALYRYERGVDPGLQRIGIDRAANLLVQICGGEVHPITVAGRTQPEVVNVRLRQARVAALLGHDIPPKEIEALLSRLGIVTRQESGGTWVARVPSYRTDIRIEHDLIEEIARLHGYENLPGRAYRAALAPAPLPEAQRTLPRAVDTLAARGWHEVVTLSFVEPRIQNLLTPDTRQARLDNPIAEQLAVMRSTLWPGLIGAWLHNHQRQQKRVRLFEAGVCFHLDGDHVVETLRIGGLAAGPAYSEQWGRLARPTDFFDVKADAAALLGADAGYRFEPAAHPALHPGQCARLTRGGTHAGWIGALHPEIAQKLDLPEAPYLFELDWPVLSPTALPKALAVGEFPSSRRDLALVVAESVTVDQLTRCIQASGGKSLSKVFVFDIYRGKGLSEASKSVALGLIFKDYSRTLTTEEIDAAVSAVTQSVTRELGAVVRQ
jgi:phenylalanyl-tRNA synthetase beta chain